jgi:hypothetical protein|tara:strand:+ start:568 stop:735 length:168 start_codon:yes stop_codon:yes gene_type:complete
MPRQVWMLHKGMWFEEMINNRNKSTVSLPPPAGPAWPAVALTGDGPAVRRRRCGA